VFNFLEEVQLSLPGTLDKSGMQPTISPASTRAVIHLLQLANEIGTSLQVPGGEEHPDRPALIMNRLDAIISVDDVSRIIHVQAGITLGTVEEKANGNGWTLGVPTELHGEQVGAWLARGGLGRADKANDPVVQSIAGLEMVLPSGAELSIRPAPRRAVGPDLIHAVIGARGRLGIIVGAHLVAQAKLAESLFAFSFPDSRAASRALTWIRGHGVRPLRTATRGNELQLVLQVEGPRYQAVAKVMRRVVAENGGTEIANPPEIGVSQASLPTSAEVFNRISKELDPRGILQP
jgi:alkyldihydroxyacetonephosphate synthase